MNVLPDRLLSPPSALVDAAKARLHRNLGALWPDPGALEPTLASADGPPAGDPPVSTDAETLAGEGALAGRTLGEFSGPAKIGRYVLLERLGEGGMGVVVAAYDPKLDRKVAIKLIHRLREDDGERRLRMEREAQAMARLSHPNVVTVYEVGEYEEQLFLAMEFVKGQDLRRWLRGPAASGWRAVLDVFIQAGQGLAAAHRVGLVHRDFKPDNVFVGEDGRVRVGDFGLARQETAPAAELIATRTQARSSIEATALAERLTATGAVMGTPAYMAPEQFLGAPTDARTDQFSFCVALWEALHGERPFAGKHLGELIVNVVTGNRQSPPAGRSAPGWLRRLLERGLSTAPADRFPSMEDLLAALRADPTRRRRLWAGAVGVALAIAGGVGAQRHVEGLEVAACAAAGASISEVWNDARRQQLQDGLLATGAAYAATTAERLVPHIAAQAEAWSAARTAACMNTRVHAIWNEDTLDRAEWCLEERRMELDALVGEFSDASTSSLQNAVVAAMGLSQVSPCLDAGRLARLPPPPQDREGARRVQALLLQARAKEAAGSFDVGLAVTEDALVQAQALAWPPLVAAARSRRGALLSQSGKRDEAEVELKDAYFQAAEVGAWEVAVYAAQRLANIMHRDDDTRLWSRHASVALALLDVDAQGLLRTATIDSLAHLHLNTGDVDKARAMFEQARAIRERWLGADHPGVAGSLTNLAYLHYRAGQWQEAKALYERARAVLETALGPDHPAVANALISVAFAHREASETDAARVLLARALGLLEKALGPDHPNVASCLEHLGIIHLNAGEFGQAKALYERALAIREKTAGPDDPAIAMSLTNLGNLHYSRGENAAAKDLYERALAIDEKAFGPDSTTVTIHLSNLANIHANAGGYEEAKRLYERVLAIRVKTLGPDHLDVAGPLQSLAYMYQDMGRFVEAKVSCERALAIEEKALSPDDPGLADSLTLLARIALAQRRTADALTLAGRAVHLRETHEVWPGRLADSRFALARALWDAPRGNGRDRERAVALARQAREGLRALAGWEKQLAEVDNFLMKSGDRER